MASSYLCLLPIAVFLWFNITFIVTFTIAVLLGHVNPVFPYISDTGTFSPESCIFGQLVNIGTWLFACVVYIRWRQAGELCTMYGLDTRTYTLNNLAAWIGLLSCVGINFVANFQVTNVLHVHVGCAALGFGCGTIWLVLQTALSYRLYPLASSALWLLRVRVIIAGFAVISFCTCTLCGVLAFLAFKVIGLERSVQEKLEGDSIKEMAKWQKEDGGWEFHITSTITEWGTALLAMTYMLTMAGEFRRVWLSSPSIRVDAPGLLGETEAGDRVAVPA